MSAPTPAPGDDRPREGYYPDPSIPGYVRYWNGAAWVPGTSRPAPSDGEPLPAPPRSATPPPAPAAAEETGPVFFDEEPGGVTQTGPDTDTNIGLGVGPGFGPGHDVGGTGAGAGAASGAGSGAGVGAGDGQHGAKPEPASAWQADAARQTGLGGEQDQRVSWGSAGATGAPGQADPRDPRARGEGAAPGAAAPAGAAAGSAAESGARRVPAQQQSGARQEPGQREQAPAAGGRPDEADADGPGTVTIRAVKPGVPKPATTEGTVTFRRPTGPVKPAGAGTPDADGGTEGTMAIRALRPKSGQTGTTSGTAAGSSGSPAAASAASPSASAASAPAAAAQAPVVPQQAVPPQQGLPPQAQVQQQSVPPQAGVASPLTSGPGGGSASWAQQVHQLAQSPQQGQSAPGGEGPVLPWKPVAADPFAAVVQAQSEARPAGLGKRLAARLVDTVVLAAVTAGAALPLGTRAADHIDSKIDAAKLSGEKATVWLLDGTTAGYLGIVLGVLLLFGVLYEALPTAKWGRTLGKKVCGIEVRDIEEHGAPSFGAALRRWLVYSVPGVLLVGVVGVLWCLFDRPWRQCWHDKAAGTFVAG
ncbi:RDD family protein [Streptomyces flavofungini]|uniref:RDD family protein n=1 Tax=Streptomyces flavofungini TaxID=68200 RepID=A0ABS0XFQ5_9ACTN|nr:RDD family protein [Streptomyces flavofungini]MBJ3812057.1 RDD family protein [Streptomyces flavofungini]GHC44537.1 hypothetical protein GCM10010349_06510 [Streptomyces flavofungini]